MHFNRIVALSWIFTLLLLIASCSSTKKVETVAVIEDPTTTEVMITESAPMLEPISLESLESRLTSLEHLLIDFRIKASGALVIDLSGSVRFAHGNVLELNGEGNFGGKDVKLSLKSDGERTNGGNGTSDFDIETPDDLRSAVVVGFTRMGILHNLARLIAGLPPDHADGGVEDWVETSRYDWDSISNSGKFDIAVAAQPSGSATITFERVYDLPTYRSQTVKFPGGTMIVEEEYSYPEPLDRSLPSSSSH